MKNHTKNQKFIGTIRILIFIENKNCVLIPKCIVLLYIFTNHTLYLYN